MDAPFPNTLQAIRPYNINPTVTSSELLGTKPIFYDLSHLSFLFQPPFTPSCSDTPSAKPCPGPIIDSYFLSFVTTEERNNFISTLIKTDQEIPYTASDGSMSTLHLLTEAWSKGVVSNFEYLLAVGFLAGRTPSVLSQYPIMPWVLEEKGYSKDTTSFDLKSIDIRDLSKPMGALDKTRLDKYKERMDFMVSIDKRNNYNNNNNNQASNGRVSPVPQHSVFPPVQPIDSIYNIIVKELFKEHQQQQQQQQLTTPTYERKTGNNKEETNDEQRSPSSRLNLININTKHDSNTHTHSQPQPHSQTVEPRNNITDATVRSLLTLLDFPPHLYPIHFSAQGHILYYLHRKAHEYHLRLQQGVLDCANRLFYSVDECYNAATHSLSDVKELIPEFFSGNGDFLANIGAQWMGRRTGGERVSGVVLPGWANNSPELFVVGHRLALESERVSKMIPKWIDIIYGYKARGKEAAESSNLFHPLSYPGYIDFDTLRTLLGIASPKSNAGLSGISNTNIDASLLEELWGLWNASVGHVYEFGVMPEQLFQEPHPEREVAVSESFCKYEAEDFRLPTAIREVPLELRYLVLGKNISDSEQTDLDSCGRDEEEAKTKYNINTYDESED